ncbi:uncharacterized protein LOC113228740 isoform X2 [Hyposmocoma kahamanoa]|uniref:uncharacterized protein LOC113228740 isoform X2 n=1 Tax=Hyposmocoma kahamanoa TaxID=1477025 RepID=UPI000E6D789F|nr:uncharacterized protein LOC113228740 isoform X2 [Hyposmocoma kahamanoa]
MANTTNKIVSNELDALNVAEVFTCLPEECLKFIDPSKYSLKIIHQNIRSINKNIDQFVVMLEITKINYDVIILSECWLSKLSNLPELTGYLSCKSLNNRNQNNGVVVYFKRHLDLTFTCPNFSEANCVLLKNDNLAILAIYRSPANKCLNGFFCDLNNSLSTLKSSRNVLLIGDINIDISSANTDLNKEKYLNLISSHGLLPTFDTPTRISSCLDHALLKSNYKATVLLLECNVTDHFPVITCLNLDRIHVKPNQSFSQTDFVSLRAEIMAMDFSTVLLCDNADHAADLLVNSIAPVLTKHTKVLRVPKRKVIFKPWITPGLLRCIRHRDKLYKRSKVNPDDYTLKRIYTRYRNFCNRLLRKLKREYEREELPITFGVPQGSILAPTLFKIYINELCQLPIPFGKTISYADDTVLVVTGPNWSIAKSYAEQALRTALDWLDNNLLTVNIEKTKYIPFSLRNSSAPPHNFTITAHSCPTPTISCQCMNLTRADHIKYLGVHIDSALRWHLHVDNLCSRVRKLIFVMSKLRNSAERNTLLIVYQALCKTLISYCIPVWGGAHKTSLLKLERAQRAVLKTMLSRPFRYPTTQLYQESNVLTVRQLFVLQITVRHHSSVPRAEYHCSTRRRKPACTTAIVRSTFASQQYTCISAFLYNKIDKLMKLAHLNKYELKKKLITWLSKLDYDSTEELLNRESLQCIYLIDK